MAPPPPSADPPAPCTPPPPPHPPFFLARTRGSCVTLAVRAEWAGGLQRQQDEGQPARERRQGPPGTPPTHPPPAVCSRPSGRPGVARCSPVCSSPALTKDQLVCCAAVQEPRGGVGADPRGDSGLRLRYLAGPTIKTPRAALLAARQPPLRLEIRVRPRAYRAHTHSAREEDGFNVA
eukprot:COSAG04_NODE_2123_length_4747_cov_3.237470_5_plen_178_part_00